MLLAVEKHVLANPNEASEGGTIINDAEAVIITLWKDGTKFIVRLHPDEATSWGVGLIQLGMVVTSGAAKRVQPVAPVVNLSQEQERRLRQANGKKE